VVLVSSQPASAQTVAACNRPQPPGRTILTVQSAGVSRTVYLYVPKAYDGTRRLPLVLTLHGSGGHPPHMMEDRGFEATPDKNRFIVAGPQGSISGPAALDHPAGPGYSWNVPGVPTLIGPGVVAAPGSLADDERFLNDAIDALDSKLCIHKGKVYATGMSGGA